MNPKRVLDHQAYSVGALALVCPIEDTEDRYVVVLALGTTGKVSTVTVRDHGRELCFVEMKTQILSAQGERGSVTYTHSTPDGQYMLRPFVPMVEGSAP